MFDDAGTYKGKVTAYDSPIYIADAALYLSKTKPDLGIKDPSAAAVKYMDNIQKINAQNAKKRAAKPGGPAEKLYNVLTGSR